MQPALNDISVLLLFHARPDNFSKVWAEVKKARPARLFLYQDGPRMLDKQGEEISDWHLSRDYDGIMACRALVSDENIDWQCEVHRNYQEKNLGCDPSEYLSQRWAFSLTDKCMVFEDDDVPSQSFFPFCKEMLDRYENDERITMIAGFNTEDTSHPVTDNSYFFTRAFSIWGWASWARVVNNWDGDYSFVKDEKKFKALEEKVKKEKIFTWMPKVCKDHAASGKQYYESIFWAYMFMHDGLAIMPRVNMVNNIGLDGGTHYNADIELLPRCQREVFTMPRHDMWPPYKHPAEVKESPEYLDAYFCRMGLDRPWHKAMHSMEELWLNITHGNITNIISAVAKRITKTLGIYKAS